MKGAWSCVLVVVCAALVGEAADVGSIYVPPEIQRLAVDVDGDGVATLADKLALALWAEMGGDLDALLAGVTTTKNGVLVIPSLPPIVSEETLSPSVAAAALQTTTGFDFATPQIYSSPGGGDFTWVEAGDLDGDGDQDIVAVHYNEDQVSILWNAGDGTFPGEATVIPTDNAPNSIAIADLDNDGRKDIVVCCEYGRLLWGGSLFILWNLGMSPWFHQAVYQQYSTGDQPRCVAAAYLDPDFNVDLVVGGLSRDPSDIALSEVYLFWGIGNRDPISLSECGYWDGVSYGTHNLRIADAAGDGAPDIILSTGAIGVKGELRAFDWECALPVYWQPDIVLQLSKIDVGDLDGDGDVDLASSNAMVGDEGLQIGVLANVSDFGLPNTYFTNTGGLYAGNQTLAVEICDLGRGSLPEIVVANHDTEQTQLTIFRNLESGSLGDVQTSFVNVGSVDINDGLTDVTTISHLGSADLNNDGLNDLYGWGDDAYVVVLINETGMQAFRRGDVNQDAKIDIADPIKILGHLFEGQPAPACMDAADTIDDNGEVNIADAVGLLNYLFAQGPPPPAPGPIVCGKDPTPDNLTCDVYAALCD